MHSRQVARVLRVWHKNYKKKQYKHLCGLVDFLNQIPTFLGTLNRPIHKFFEEAAKIDIFTLQETF